jgi:sodium-coupled neutral amino acid transporter 9
VLQRKYLKKFSLNVADYSFAIWNTIMGSSLLSMPWGVERAGLGGGLLLMVGMSSLCLYTSWRLLRVNSKHGKRRT